MWDFNLPSPCWDHPDRPSQWSDHPGLLFCNLVSLIRVRNVLKRDDLKYERTLDTEEKRQLKEGKPYPYR